MNIIFEIISLIFWFLIILTPLVAIHEFGHFLMSRLSGVKIPEFAVGMPLTKRWFAKKWKGTIWAFYPLLLGGFVRIWGDNDAIDEAFEANKTNPKTAKVNYVQDRFQEIMSLNSLPFFLKENDLEYDTSWKEFEKSKFAQGKEEELSSEDKAKYEKKFNQLATLIEWEFDAEIHGKNAFFTKSWLQQALIIFGGIIFNFLTAIGIFWVMFSFLNLPVTPMDLETYHSFKPYIEIREETEHVRVQAVVKDGALAEAGFKIEDQLISIAGKKLRDFKTQRDLTDFLQTLGTQETELVYLSNETGEEINTNLNLQEIDGRYFLGVAGSFYREVEYNAKNPIVGLQLAGIRTFQFSRMIFQGLADLVTSIFTGNIGEKRQEMAGVIAIARIGGQVFDMSGIPGILELIALISVNLAILNMLPIPALDGGRFIILTINKIVGRRSKKIEGLTIGITFAFLMLLQLLFILNDIDGILSGRFG